jgi:hypothetical protein
MKSEEESQIARARENERGLRESGNGVASENGERARPRSFYRTRKPEIQKFQVLWWRFLPAKFGHIFGLFPPNVNYSTN